MDLRIPASFSKKDSIIYSLGIGCGDLRYLFEARDGFTSFPTIAFALTLKGDSQDVQPFPPQFVSVSSVPINGPVLDGERLLELRRPLRATERLYMITKETAISQVRSGTIVQTETLIHDADSGEIVAKVTSNTFYVGTTKGVITKGNPAKFVIPVPSSRPPDMVVERATSTIQAALYRLSGDYNPLHIDPDVALAFGYKQPILHGLCTLGFACNIVVETCMNGDESRVRRIGCRFSKPTFPGHVLRIEIWRVDPNRLSFRVKDPSGLVVIDQAFIDTVNTDSGRL
jgi:3-hydroxyacyl-CoA dehydrogenase/3a,7a,12a-trihydroxy-5b-cholest-24-enoyl-CoA hydratase